jgi:hypothetical protein
MQSRAGDDEHKAFGPHTLGIPFLQVTWVSVDKNLCYLLDTNAALLQAIGCVPTEADQPTPLSPRPHTNGTARRWCHDIDLHVFPHEDTLLQDTLCVNTERCFSSHGA